MSQPTTSNVPRQRESSSRRRERQRVDCNTALELIHACVATDVQCVAEIIRYARTAPLASPKLLEEVLAIENAHAMELLGILRMHRISV